MRRLLAAVTEAKRARGAALMGVLNVTPDSFYDGGRYAAGAAAVARVSELMAQGADLIDIGAESSRPGACAVLAAEQLERLEAPLRAARTVGALVSVDTTSPEVAEASLASGAAAVNDVSCLANPDLARVVAAADAVLVLMHTRGALGSMAGFSEYPESGYADLIAEVRAEWEDARERAVAAGLARDHVWFDPGLGFAKNAAQSLALLRDLDRLAPPEVPTVVGPSRKSFLAVDDQAPPTARLGGTIAACLVAAARGGCILRVHDVADVRQALFVSRSLTRASGASDPRPGLGDC